MWIAENWKDYEVLDTSKGEKLERWGDYTLVRPDPQVIWDTPKTLKGWKRPNAHYHRSKRGGGEWEFFDLPEQWNQGCIVFCPHDPGDAGNSKYISLFCRSLRNCRKSILIYKNGALRFRHTVCICLFMDIHHMCLAAFVEMCQFLFIHTVSIRPVNLFRLVYPHYPHFKPSVRLFHLCSTRF